ncbi:ABC transporter permease [Patulibacter defluvii]|uniref:ABC transporter permease n=1 Tax=Patulibacter defluvii TaxID=3095358 RepID=UPI002A763D53|nr:ABC transporter permease [Patulibacter sp. DM4]
MNLRRMLAIYRKDLVDAIRDGRVLVAILIPIGLGVFYSLAFDDDTPRPSAKVAVVGASADAARVAAALPKDVDRAIDLKVEREREQPRARQQVAKGDVDLAIVVPDGLLADARAGRAPPLTLLARPSPDPTVASLADLVPATIARLADRPPAVGVALRPVPAADQSAYDALGLRRFFALAAVAMLLGMIGLLVTPIVLAEEIDKRTLEALLLAARGGEVLTAKALVGLTYGAVATAGTVLLTRLPVPRPGLFVLGALGLAIALIGFGLWLAYLFRSPDKLNTWMGVLLFPALTPVFLVDAGLSPVVDGILQALPTTQGMRLLVDGAVDQDIFGHHLLAVAVLAVWAVAGFALLARTLQRRGG